MGIIRGIGIGFLIIIKMILWMIAKLFVLALEVTKLILLLFGLVKRIFLIFVRAEIPE